MEFPNFVFGNFSLCRGQCFLYGLWQVGALVMTMYECWVVMRNRNKPLPLVSRWLLRFISWFSKNQTHNHGFHKGLKKNYHWAIVHGWPSLETHPYIHIIHTKRPKVNLSQPFYHHIKPFDSHIKMKTNSHFHTPRVFLLIYSSSILFAIANILYTLYAWIIFLCFALASVYFALVLCFLVFVFVICFVCVLHLSLICLCYNFFVCASRFTLSLCYKLLYSLYTLL